jgi:hypothetical protein
MRSLEGSELSAVACDEPPYRDHNRLPSYQIPLASHALLWMQRSRLTGEKMPSISTTNLGLTAKAGCLKGPHKEFCTKIATPPTHIFPRNSFLGHRFCGYLHVLPTNFTCRRLLSTLESILHSVTFDISTSCLPTVQQRSRLELMTKSSPLLSRAPSLQVSLS